MLKVGFGVSLLSLIIDFLAGGLSLMIGCLARAAVNTPRHHVRC